MGQRIVRLLQKHVTQIAIVGGSRHPAAHAPIPARKLDYADTSTFDTGLANIDILIHAAGPFEHNPAQLVSACIARGIHYLDIAEAPHFIEQVRAVAAQAQRTHALNG